MIKMPNNPIKWANRISNMLDYVSKAHGLKRYPIDIASIASEYSRQAYPNEPLSLIKGEKLSNQIEGMLLPNPNKNNEWGIIYNSSIKSKGRINFTLCHEFGHYLMHRNKSPSGFQCSSRDMMKWDSEKALVEMEANTFASHLLMPLDDFRRHLHRREVTLELFGELSNRYSVSITATILKWLEITNQRAMIVVGKDGFIDWAWSNAKLMKSGIFFKARQTTTELPSQSLAARRDKNIDNSIGVTHPKGVWLGDEEVKEMAIITDEYDNMTISLLIYPQQSSLAYENDEEPSLDSFDHVTRFT